jgi:hypothetical protein
MKKIFYWFLLCISISCGKETEIEDNCIDYLIASGQFLKYSDDDNIGCKFFITKCQYVELTTYTLGNHCMDMHVIPVVCEGKTFRELTLEERSMLSSNIFGSNCEIFLVRAE